MARRAMPTDLLAPWIAVAACAQGAETAARLEHTSRDPMKCKVCRPACEKVLALALVRADQPGDHGLVACYAAACGETAECRDHLARAGADAAERHACLKTCGLLD